MPSWLAGKHGEKAWRKAKGIVVDQYGKGLEKSDPDRFYSLVTTVYKNICKSDKYDCGIKESVACSKGAGFGDLVDRLSLFLEAISDVKVREAEQSVGL